MVVALEKLTKTQVVSGVFWVEVPEAELFVLCGCPEDSVKLLMQQGLIRSTRTEETEYETGPNVVLLSDVPIQNGAFCNLPRYSDDVPSGHDIAGAPQ